MSVRDALLKDPKMRDAVRGVHSRVKSVQEYLEEVVKLCGEPGKTPTEIGRALAEAAPWATTLVGALGEAVPIVKFLLKLFQGLTAIDDPEELGLLACSLAYQQAVQQSVAEVLGVRPPPASRVRAELPATGPAPPYDFKTFSFESAATHPFVRDANVALRAFGEFLGFEETWNVRLQREVQARFLLNLKVILSHGKTRERFAPFRELLAEGSEEARLLAAIYEHIDGQRGAFEEQPILGREPFSLGQVYVEPKCGPSQRASRGADLPGRRPARPHPRRHPE